MRVSSPKVEHGRGAALKTPRSPSLFREIVHLQIDHGGVKGFNSVPAARKAIPQRAAGVSR